MTERGRPQRVIVAAIAATVLAAGALGGELELAVWLAPLCLLAVPLAGGRYVGERRIERLGRRARRPRPAATRQVRARLRRSVPRGGRLVGRALAGRSPPAALVP